MLIDWFTIGAQALNFLILVWLMKRFLYQPILNAIDAREQRIAAELADAAASKADAQQERDAFDRRNRQFDQQRAGLLGEATKQAGAERQRLLEEAHAAADALDQLRRQALHNQARDLDHALVQQTRQEVFAIARKVLHDLADSSLEQRVAAVFIRRLQAVDAPTRDTLAAALASHQPAIVRSAFELPAPQQTAIRQALDATFPGGSPLQFEIAPALISGIELVAGGRKLAWSIDDYLATLESGLRELLQRHAGTESAPEGPAPETVPAKPAAAVGEHNADNAAESP
jgi:F-type H+-transporting ATPase subunit b